MVSSWHKNKLADHITCRQILAFMVISGFMFNHMLRVNLPIAITAMVGDENNDTSLTSNDTNVTTSHKFNWNKYEQNLIFGMFFWGYLMTELPGGRLAEIIGTKMIFGGGMLVASILTLLTPLTCYLGAVPVMILNGILGLSFGSTFPSVLPIITKWIIPTDRSKFMSNFGASALGAALTLPACGFLIDRFGWSASFYVTGTIGLLWCVWWFYLVYESPAAHPRINLSERTEIERKIAEVTIGKTPNFVPWRRLITSGPVWAIIITQGCCNASYITLAFQLPTYMKEVLNYNIKQNGMFSGLPYLGNYMVALIAGYLADRIIAKGNFPTTLVRKGFVSFSMLIPGVLMAIQAVFGEDPIVSVIIFTLTLSINGATVAGHQVNGLDIAPNFCATILSIASALASLGGYVSIVIVAALTNENHNFQQWSYVFWMLCGFYTFGTCTYLILGSANLQPWNSVDSKENEVETQKFINENEIP